MIVKGSSLNKLKHKILKPNHHWIQKHIHIKQKDRINGEFIKKIMSEQKITLLSLRIKGRKKVKLETEKVIKVLQHITTAT